MICRGLLPCFSRRILKTTPESLESLDGKVYESVSEAARPTSGQREARVAGSSFHRAGRRAVRWGVVHRYGGLRSIEGRAVAACSSFGARHPEPRYVHSGVPTA